jgi:hypothetical protein
LEGERTKNGEDHTIPLSVAAQDLIDTVPRVAGSPFCLHHNWQYADLWLVAAPRRTLTRSCLPARNWQRGIAEKIPTRLTSRNGAFMI